MKIKKLDLNLIPQLHSQEVQAKRKVLSRTLEGSWTTLLKGRGMEFAGFRQYVYGDDASAIDWGASLRSKDVLIREYEEYKNVNVLFLFDVSNTMLFTSHKKLKAEYGAELVFNLAVSILDNGDSVGHVMFADRVVTHKFPAIGRQVIYDLATQLSNPAAYGGKRNFIEVIGLVNAMLKQRALIVLVSDFVGMDPGWEQYVRMLAEKFDLIGIMVRDRHDSEMPEVGSQYILEDPGTHERIFVDVKQVKEDFDLAAAQEEKYIKNIFDTAKAGFIKMHTDQDMFDTILKYFRKRTSIARG